MLHTSLMDILPLQSLRANFKKQNLFFDARLYELLKEQDFTPDAWTVLSLLRIPTAKDLIERLAETNRDGGLEVNTHFSVIHAEFKNYLSSHGFPIEKSDIQPINRAPKTDIGIASCAENSVVLLGFHYLDYFVGIQSTTSETAPESLWHTKLTFKDTSFGKESCFVLRPGDKVTMEKTHLTPLQIEHLGFEGQEARLNFRSQNMQLKAA